MTEVGNVILFINGIQLGGNGLDSKLYMYVLCWINCQACDVHAVMCSLHINTCMWPCTRKSDIMWTNAASSFWNYDKSRAHSLNEARGRVDLHVCVSQEWSLLLLAFVSYSALNFGKNRLDSSANVQSYVLPCPGIGHNSFLVWR